MLFRAVRKPQEPAILLLLKKARQSDLLRAGSGVGQGVEWVERVLVAFGKQAVRSNWVRSLWLDRPEQALDGP